MKNVLFFICFFDFGGVLVFLSPLSHSGSHNTVEKFGFLSELWWTKKVASHRTSATTSVDLRDLVISLMKQAGN